MKETDTRVVQPRLVADDCGGQALADEPSLDQSRARAWLEPLERAERFNFEVRTVRVYLIVHTTIGITCCGVERELLDEYGARPHAGTPPQLVSNADFLRIASCLIRCQRDEPPAESPSSIGHVGERPERHGSHRQQQLVV